MPKMPFGKSSPANIANISGTGTDIQAGEAGELFNGGVNAGVETVEKLKMELW